MSTFFSIFKKRSRARPASRFRSTGFQRRIAEARKFRRIPVKTTSDSGRRRGRLYYWRILFVLFLLALIFTGGYGIFYSGYFDADNVIVTGASRLQPEAVSSWIEDPATNRIWGIFPGNNWLWLDTQRIEMILKSRSAYILSVPKVVRTWPDRLEIEIEERTSVVVWRTGSQSFSVSRDGVIFEAIAAETATSTGLVVADLSGQPAVVGEDLGIADTIAFLREITAEWDKQITSPIVLAQVASRASPDLDLVSQAGWTVYMDRTLNSTRQLRNLTLILSQEIPLDRQSELQYIDLRLPAMAYYCYRNEPCAGVPAEIDGETGESQPSGKP